MGDFVPTSKPVFKLGDMVMISHVQGSWRLGKVVRIEPLHFRPRHEEREKGLYEWSFTVELEGSGAWWGAAHKMHIRPVSTDDITAMFVRGLDAEDSCDPFWRQTSR